MHMEEEKDLEQPVPETRQGGEVKVQKVEFHPLPLDSTAPPRQERAPAFDKVSLKLTAELGKPGSRSGILLTWRKGPC